MLLRARIELQQWKAVAALVEENSWWGARDVGDLRNDTVGSSGRPVVYYFARLAHQQGRTDLEGKLLEMQLVGTPGADCLYESYLTLRGKDAHDFLGKLEAADRFEERPLIWRAKLQMDAGDWDGAIASLDRFST